MDMRLFSKVKPGTAYAADIQNSGKSCQTPQPFLQDTRVKDDAADLQASEQESPAVGLYERTLTKLVASTPLARQIFLGAKHA